jgi:hypothetical protein
LYALDKLLSRAGYFVLTAATGWQHADRREVHDALDPKQASALEHVNGPHHVDLQSSRRVLEQKERVHDPANVHDLVRPPLPDNFQKPRPVIYRGVFQRDAHIPHRSR